MNPSSVMRVDYKEGDTIEASINERLFRGSYFQGTIVYAFRMDNTMFDIRIFLKMMSLDLSLMKFVQGSSNCYLHASVILPSSNPTKKWTFLIRTGGG